MKKFDLPLWSDTLFCFFCFGLLFTCLFRYFRIKLFLSLLLAMLLSMLLSVLYFHITYKMRQKKYLIGQDCVEKEKLMLHLALLGDEVTTSLLSQFCNGKYDGKNFFMFTMQPLSADTIALKIKQNADCDFSIWCNELSPEAQKLCTRFDIQVLDGNMVYSLLKEKNALPEKYIGGNKVTKSLSEKVRSVFKKSNTHAFFSSGATLLFLSLFSFYPVYYLAIGGVLLSVSIVLKLFVKG